MKIRTTQASVLCLPRHTKVLACSEIRTPLLPFLTARVCTLHTIHPIMDTPSLDKGISSSSTLKTGRSESLERVNQEVARRTTAFNRLQDWIRVNWRIAEIDHQKKAAFEMLTIIQKQDDQSERITSLQKDIDELDREKTCIDTEYSTVLVGVVDAMS